MVGIAFPRTWNLKVVRGGCHRTPSSKNLDPRQITFSWFGLDGFVESFWHVTVRLDDRESNLQTKRSLVGDQSVNKASLKLGVACSGEKNSPGVHSWPPAVFKYFHDRFVPSDWKYYLIYLRWWHNCILCLALVSGFSYSRGRKAWYVLRLFYAGNDVEDNFWFSTWQWFDKVRTLLMCRSS